MLILNVAGDYVDDVKLPIVFLFYVVNVYFMWNCICCCLGQDSLVKEILNLNGISPGKINFKKDYYGRSMALVHTRARAQTSTHVGIWYTLVATRVHTAVGRMFS